MLVSCHQNKHQKAKSPCQSKSLRTATSMRCPLQHHGLPLLQCKPKILLCGRSVSSKPNRSDMHVQKSVYNIYIYDYIYIYSFIYLFLIHLFIYIKSHASRYFKNFITYVTNSTSSGLKESNSHLIFLESTWSIDSAKLRGGQSARFTRRFAAALLQGCRQILGIFSE